MISCCGALAALALLAAALLAALSRASRLLLLLLPRLLAAWLLLTGLLAALLLLTRLLASALLLATLLATLLLLARTLLGILVLILAHSVSFQRLAGSKTVPSTLPGPTLKNNAPLRPSFPAAEPMRTGDVDASSLCTETNQRGSRHGTVSFALAAGHSASDPGPDLAVRRPALTSGCKAFSAGRRLNAISRTGDPTAAAWGKTLPPRHGAPKTTAWLPARALEAEDKDDLCFRRGELITSPRVPALPLRRCPVKP